MVRRSLLVAAAVAVALGALTACTALLGIDKDYQLADDASADVLGADGPSSDGAPPDAGTDAHFCATLAATGPDADKVVFCDDFDLGKPVGFGWQEKSVDNSSSLAIDTDAAVSAPASLLALTPLGDGGYFQAGIGYEHVPTHATQYLAVEVSVRIDDANGPNADAIQPIEIGLGKWANLPEWRARINAYPDHAELEEFEQAADGGATWDWTGLTEYFLVGQWVHVTLRVDLVARTVDVWFDAAHVLAAHPLKFQWPLGQTPELGVGNLGPRWGYQGPWAVRIDNVVFKAE
jgi:hypothetical protein